MFDMAFNLGVVGLLKWKNTLAMCASCGPFMSMFKAWRTRLLAPSAPTSQAASCTALPPAPSPVALSAVTRTPRAWVSMRDTLVPRWNEIRGSSSTQRHRAGISWCWPMCAM